MYVILVSKVNLVRTMLMNASPSKKVQKKNKFVEIMPFVRITLGATSVLV